MPCIIQLIALNSNLQKPEENIRVVASRYVNGLLSPPVRRALKTETIFPEVLGSVTPSNAESVFNEIGRDRHVQN